MEKDKNIGKKLDGRYEITELIGVGGMADVYRGTDIIDNKSVAIKILKRNLQIMRSSSVDSEMNQKLSHCFHTPILLRYMM